MITRAENIQFEFEFNRATIEQYMEQIQTLLGKNVVDLQDQDKCTVKWNFFIEYFDDIQKKLQLIHELLQNGVPLKVDLVDLKHGNCIIQQLFLQVDKILGEKLQLLTI